MEDVVCMICGRHFDAINHLHLRKHNISVGEYVEQFPNASLSSSTMLKNRSKSLKGKKRTEEWKRKISESNKASWKQNPKQGRTGRALSKKSKKALSEKLQGHSVSNETRRKIGIAGLGREPWNKGLTKDDDSRLKSVSKKVRAWNQVAMTAEKRQQISQTLKQKYAAGMPIPNSKIGMRKDLGMSFRSTWEANFARILKFQSKKIIYEQDRFTLLSEDGTIECVYTPDFRISDSEYIEIKGHADSFIDWTCDCSRCKRDKNKHKLMDEQYPNISIHIVGKKEYRQFALYYKGLDCWEQSSYDPV